VLYVHFRQGKPIREAMLQLGWKYLHVRAGKTGVLDYVFDRYLAEGEPAGLGFLAWVESDRYDPAQLKADFQTKWWANVVTEKLLRRE
jgi:protein tyrosine/serine phosphatase